jgi:hypothetical protein
MVYKTLNTLALARYLKYGRVVIETACARVMSAVKNPEKDRSEISVIIARPGALHICWAIGE